MKARIINNEWAGNFSLQWLEDNYNLFFGDQFVSEWELTDILPTEEEKKYYKLMFNGTSYYEGATIEEIQIYQKSLVPKIVSQRQLRTQLVFNGFDLETIQNAINQLPEPDKKIAQIAWDYAVTFERESPLLISLASSLGLSQNNVDEIFTNASNL